MLHLSGLRLLRERRFALMTRSSLNLHSPLNASLYPRSKRSRGLNDNPLFTPLLPFFPPSVFPSLISLLLFHIRHPIIQHARAQPHTPLTFTLALAITTPF